MSAILMPGQDPRHERRVGNPEGLARRVAELERKLARFEAAPYVPNFRVSGSGPFNTAVPGATTGTAVAITVPGVYAVYFGASGYQPTSAGMGYVDAYRNGSVFGNAELYFNQAGVHMELHARWHYITLDAGTHYFAPRHVVMISDTNDRFDFLGIRVSAA